MGAVRADLDGRGRSDMPKRWALGIAVAGVLIALVMAVALAQTTKSGEVATFTVWTVPLDMLVDGSGLDCTKVRIAVKSMREGNPTFIDQMLAGQLVDWLFTLYQTALLEEEAIGGGLL